MSPMLLTTVANLPLVLLIPVVHLDLRIFSTGHFGPLGVGSRIQIQTQIHNTDRKERGEQRNYNKYLRKKRNGRGFLQVKVEQGGEKEE